MDHVDCLLFRSRLKVLIRSLELKRIFLLLVLLFPVTHSSSTANDAVNGDFEAGNTGFVSEFVYSPGNITPASTYDVVTDPNNSHPSAISFSDHTTGNGLMLAVNGSTDTESVFWSQGVTVTPNTEYEFTLWTATWASNGLGGTLRLRINAADVGAPFESPMSTDGNWQKTTLAWNSGSSDFAMLELVNLSSQFSGNDFAVDDISFAPVKETLLGDVNLDGVVNLLDVAPFVERLSNGEFQAEADCNQDGVVNLLDVDPFILLLGNG